ncbi:hypothetical protein PpBr36_00429 [Pyricularia pennisetigena]|uniref:hypothetical protein n=1 Tax=Pyricularia pennisetigena TaxID=1578925 RepID=UPI00115227F1|nr:hypothetical protein PpBr36_00429 [Pyricularia pennisetigena]TLS28448.1 hypothetical protein PpBr36_00429 [Pyricularia pennisetigena]
MSNPKASSEYLKSRVIELGITRRVKDGRMVTVLLEDKSEKLRSRESSATHASLRSTSCSGMTRFQAAREAARAWSGGKKMSRRGYSSPASQESVQSTRSAPVLVRHKALSPSKLDGKSPSQGASSNQKLEGYESTASSTTSVSNQSLSNTDQRILPSRRSNRQRKDDRRRASHSRHHAGHNEDQKKTQGPSTLVDTQASVYISGQGSEKVTGPEISHPRAFRNVTETAQDLGQQANSTPVHSNPVPNISHTTFSGFVQNQPQYHHHLNTFAAQHAAEGMGATPVILRPSDQDTTNGYHVYYVSHSYPCQVPFFSPSAVMPQLMSSNQVANSRVQTVTASQAAQAAALTLVPTGDKELRQSKNGTSSGQVPQHQVPQVVIYTAASSGDSTATPLVSPTYSVDSSQPSGLGAASTAVSDSNTAVSNKNHTKSRPTRNGEFGRISLDSEAGPRPDSMQSEASTNSKATSHAHGRLLGPLSKHYFCFGCGRVRSKRFHRQNPIKDHQDPDTNYCANCRRAHAENAAHNSVSSPSSAYPEIVMPESSSIGSTSHLSHFNKYQSLREGFVGRLPDTPTRKSTRREGSNLLCGSPEQNCLVASRQKSTSRLTTPTRQTLPGSRSVRAGCGLRIVHNRAYRPPSVESVIDSSLEYANETPRCEKPRSQTLLFSADNAGAAATEVVPGVSGLQRSDELRTSPLSNEPKQVRFDQRLDEWFSQSSQVHADGSEYSQDCTVQKGRGNIENHEATVADGNSSNSSPTILGEGRVREGNDPCEDILHSEKVNEDEDEEDEDDDDDDDDDDDPFAIPARSHKPKLFPVTIRMVRDESVVSTRQESASPTPVPRFRSVSDRGSPMRNFSEKLAATKHDPIPLQPQSPFASLQPRGGETSITGSRCGQESEPAGENHSEVDALPVSRPRRVAPAPVSTSAFQFRASGPHNYSSLPPAPASAPPTRKAFDFSSLADDYRDKSDPFYCHSLSEQELEQCFQEPDGADSWTGCDTEAGLDGFAEYEEGGSNLLDEEDNDCAYAPLHPDDVYFSME